MFYCEKYLKFNGSFPEILHYKVYTFNIIERKENLRYKLIINIYYLITIICN